MDLLTNSSCLTETRNILCLAIGYSLLLRHDELSHLNCLYIIECALGFKFFIPSSKTDVYRNGKTVYLAKSEDRGSVFQVMKRYLFQTGLKLGQNHFLFTPIKNGMVINEKLSYSYFRQNIRVLTSRVGLDPNIFGTHSVRSGAASDLASKVTERELLLSGRWRDPRSLNSYIKVSDPRRFAISRELSLDST